MCTSRVGVYSAMLSFIIVSMISQSGETAYRYGSDEEAPRREINVFWRRMVLGWSEVPMQRCFAAIPAFAPCTSLATNWLCQAAGAMNVAADLTLDLSCREKAAEVAQTRRHSGSQI